jgi:hypothetical protein
MNRVCLVAVASLVWLSPAWGQSVEHKEATITYLRVLQKEDGGFQPAQPRPGAPLLDTGPGHEPGRADDCPCTIPVGCSGDRTLTPECPVQVQPGRPPAPPQRRFGHVQDGRRFRVRGFRGRSQLLRRMFTNTRFLLGNMDQRTPSDPWRCVVSRERARVTTSYRCFPIRQVPPGWNCRRRLVDLSALFLGAVRPAFAYNKSRCPGPGSSGCSTPASPFSERYQLRGPTSWHGRERNRQ